MFLILLCELVEHVMNSAKACQWLRKCHPSSLSMPKVLANVSRGIFHTLCGQYFDIGISIPVLRIRLVIGVRTTIYQGLFSSEQ